MIAKITNVQVALFFPVIDMSDKLSLAQKIRSKTAGLFDGDPIVLPIPNDAPAEIPRIILRNKIEGTILNISNSKIDLFIRPIDENGDFQGIFKKTKKTYNDVLKALFAATTLAVYRVGYVINQELAVAESNKFIADHYFGSFTQEKEWQDINLGLLKQNLIDKKNSNIWFRINPSREDSGDVDIKKLSLMLDVNTLPKETHTFTTEDILKYLEEASMYLDKYIQEFIK